MATVKIATYAEEGVVTRGIERIGLLVSVAAALLLTVVLVGDVAILLFAYTPSDWQLTVLRVGPPVALVLGAIGSLATWYHWLRLTARWLFRREQPDVPKEAKGLVQDMGLDVPGALDQQVRHHRRELRGCGWRMLGCAAQVALWVFVGGVIVTVATLGPGPLRVLAVGPLGADGRVQPFGTVSPTPISSVPTPSSTPFVLHGTPTSPPGLGSSAPPTPTAGGQGCVPSNGSGGWVVACSPSPGVPPAMR